MQACASPSMVPSIAPQPLAAPPTIPASVGGTGTTKGSAPTSASIISTATTRIIIPSRTSSRLSGMEHSGSSASLTLEAKDETAAVVTPTSMDLEPISSSSSSASASTEENQTTIIAKKNVCGDKEKVGRWSQEEHEVFLEGLESFGKQWKVIAGLIGTRTVVQVRTHAQKYFQKVDRNGGAMSFSATSASEIPNKKPSSSKNSGSPKKKQPKRKAPKKIKISLGKSQINKHQQANAFFATTGSVPNPFLEMYVAIEMKCLLYV